VTTGIDGHHEPKLAGLSGHDIGPMNSRDVADQPQPVGRLTIVGAA
jgi:hypothetical protein